MPEQQHGVLVLDKPSGPSSTGCLEKIKRSLKQKKIGHAGTLDPMASGVLLVLLGRATKLAGHLTEGRKTYSGELQIGLSTETYDMEGLEHVQAPWEHLDEDAVLQAVMEWPQMQTQVIPPYSAAKHKGKPLYKLSREGKETPVKTKPLTVTRAEVLQLDLPRVRFRVECGAGTYIRSLVHSLGIRLGCGAVLTELIRERSHPFGLEQAVSLEQLLQAPDLLAEKTLPLEATLPHWHKVACTERQAALVRNGGRIDYAPETARVMPFAPGNKAMLLDPDGRALALAEAVLEDGRPVWAILRGLW